MDRITSIETELQTLISTIAVPIITSASPPPVGYQYYTSTGTVQIEDEVLSLATNVDSKMVNYVIYLDQPEVNEEWSIGQCAYTNTLMFRVVGRVHLLGSEGNPKFQINQKMNEVVSDFKYLFGSKHTLNGKCNYVRYMTSERRYNENNNRIFTAEIDIILMVNYSQSLNNPDLGACL